MKNTTAVIIYSLLTLTTVCNAQTFDKKFTGCWGETFWDFHFYKNGRYERTSSGHFGATTEKGRYSVVNDSVHIKSGYQRSAGTINEWYIIDPDGVLIDTRLGYGYLPEKADQTLSEKCGLHYPYITATNSVTKLLIENALNAAFNNSEMKQFYHFKTIPQRRFIIANYYKLEANITIDKYKAVFLPAEKIKDSFYIEFKDFSYSPNLIYFNVFIHNENAGLQFIYKKQDTGEWFLEKPVITEQKGH